MCNVNEEEYCQIPNVGTVGGPIIRDSGGKVLGLSSSLAIAEWEEEDDLPDQIWQRSAFDPENCFTLTNKDTDKLLHGLRGSYLGNRLNNDQPHMPSKDLVQGHPAQFGQK